jgi:hypothetical protein
MSENASLSCPWCSAVAPASSTTCPDCGAAIAQRESIGDLVIPGVTSIDPALADADGRPLRIAGPSPAQGAATGAIAAVVLGGPVGLAALGGMAAVGAAEYVAANRRGPGRPENIEDVGRPSEVTLKALENMKRAEAGEPDAPETDLSADPWRDLPSEPA